MELMESFINGNFLRRILFLLLVIIYSGAVKISGQVPLLIDRAAAGVFLSFNKNGSLQESELKTLRALFDSEINYSNFESEFSCTEASFLSLRKHLTILESEVKKISSDSALYLFNQWFLYFSNTFYQYKKERFFSSNRTKILFFSTSMSCPCTLEMCQNQLMEILDFVSQRKNESYDLMVVDSYRNERLQIEYGISFLPAAAVLNGENKIVHKIEYEKEMLAKLTEFLKSNIYGK